MRESEYDRIRRVLGEQPIRKPALDYDILEDESTGSGREFSRLKMRLYVDSLRKPVVQKPVPALASNFFQEFLKSIPHIHRQHLINYTNVLNHQRKIATICMRELRRGLSKTSKTNPGLKTKKMNKELTKHLSRLHREEKDKIKKKDAQNELKKKNEIAMKEELRQQRKFNYLMSQTEAFASFFLNRHRESADGEEGLKAAREHLAHVREFDREKGKPESESESEPLPTGYVHNIIKQPAILQTTLREYQLKGLNWLVSLYNQGINGILADDMGLGKTVQAISFLGYLAETEDIWGPFLVVTPASTLHNWENEFSKFVPAFDTMIYYGNIAERADLRKQIKKTHVIITSYQVAVTDENILKKIRWQYMILDEAQAIKSISSQRWKTLLNFKARNRCLLTGTPIQNNMQELWSLLHFIMPTLFDSLTEFSEWFLTDNGIDETQVDKLHTILKPFMLRRHKDDIKDEIGAKEIVHVCCDLSPRQRMLYDEIMSARGRYGRGTGGDDKNGSEYENVIMQLKKVCNHPDLFEKLEAHSAFSFSIDGSVPFAEYRSTQRKYIPSWATADRAYPSDALQRLEYLRPLSPSRLHPLSRDIAYFIKKYKLADELSDDNSLAPLLNEELDRKRRATSNSLSRFIFTTERAVFPGLTTNLPAERAATNILPCPAQSIPPPSFFDRLTFVPPINTFITDSGKLLELDRLLLRLRSESHRILIYFQMTKMMDLFEEYLIKKEYSYLRLDGSSKVSHRKELVEGWQTRDIFIFMLSTRAGGVGLNLTAADTVVFYDSDWNPTVDQQAMDRVHRLGQTKKVTVYRLITRDSIEEKIMERANKKDEMQKIVIRGRVFEGN